METELNIPAPSASGVVADQIEPSESNHNSSADSVLIPAPSLASSRYHRQLLIPSLSLAGQGRLSRAKVLMIGLGGLGSPAALYLAGAGVHTLGLLDDDRVELSNLHRQILHRESSVAGGGGGMSKVASAIRACRELNGEVEYVGHETRVTGQNVLKIVEEYDMVLDCTDNPATRYLISDACVLLRKPLVSGAAQRLEGQLMVLNHPAEGPDKAPCYRCVFPRPPSPEMVRGCGEVGILGTVVGTIGVLMAGEAIKLIVQGEAGRVIHHKPSMLLYNAWSTDPRGIFRTIGLRGRRRDCVACGEEDVLRERGLKRITKEAVQEGRMDYEAFCGRVEDVSLLGEEHRIGAADFLRRMREDGGPGRSLVVDVREVNEFELGTKVKGSINIPISKILREGVAAFDGIEQNMQRTGQGSMDHPTRRPIYLVCQRGNDSQIAAQKLIDQQQGMKGNQTTAWIGDVKGGFLAMERV